MLASRRTVTTTEVGGVRRVNPGGGLEAIRLFAGTIFPVRFRPTPHEFFQNSQFIATVPADWCGCTRRTPADDWRWASASPTGDRAIADSSLVTSRTDDPFQSAIFSLARSAGSELYHLD